MKVYARKQKPPQQRVAPNLTVSGLRPLAARNPISPHSQRIPENQGVQPLPGADAEELEVLPGAPATPRVAHDFSRIPVHAKAPAGLQAKRAVDSAGDVYEQEADEVSDRVTRTSDSSNTGQAAPPRVVNEALASPGRPLDPATRSYLEPRFGYDFSPVRVHSGALAERSAQSLNAKAYTVGHHVVFGPGRLAPGTHEGQRLLAHELAHVVQQSRGGTPQLSLDGDGPLEEAADRAATQAFTGSGPVAVAGAAGPGPMCQPDEPEPTRTPQAEEEEAEEGKSSRQIEKERTQQRRQERATAGRQESQLTQAQAERELRALEDSYRQPGAQTRSLKRKADDLRRYEKLLELAQGTPLEKNKRKGAFDELQRTPSVTAGKPQTKHVAGGPQLPEQELRPGREHYAQPDYSIYRRRPDGTLERIHVNLKSDKIDMQTVAKARSTARTYLDQALKNSKHLAEGEKIVISFARTPAADVQEAMKQELFVKGSPVSEVRFGSTTHKVENYTPPAAPTQPPARAKKKATRAGGGGQPAKKQAGSASTPASPKKPARPSASQPAATRPSAPKSAPKAAPVARPTAVKPTAVKATPVKSQSVRPVAPKTVTPAAAPRSAAPGRGSRFAGVHGRGVGVLIALAASFIASEAQAAVEEDRFTKGYNVDSKEIEKGVNAQLSNMSQQFMDHHVRHPDVTLYANVTICVHTFDGYVVAGDDAVTWTDYNGTNLERVELGMAPVEKTRVERDGSARRGGSDIYRYITYPVKLATPPMEDLATYARLSGMDLKPLRSHAVARRDEIARVERGAVGAKMNAHWSDVLDIIDADDTDLMLRAQTERLPVEDVRSYLALKAERIQRSIDMGAYPPEPGAVVQLVTQAEKTRELLALLDAPFEDIVDYARKKGKNLSPLGNYAVQRATKAAGDAGASAETRTYWSQMVRYIDRL